MRAFVLGALAHAIFVPECAAQTASAEPEWDEAVAVTAELGDGAVDVILHISPGFHVYGRKERIAVPLSLGAGTQRLRARVPKGTRHRLDSGVTSWWVEGTVRISVRTDARSGWVNYQVCSEGSCAPPTEQAWMVP